MKKQRKSRKSYPVVSILSVPIIDLPRFPQDQEINIPPSKVAPIILGYRRKQYWSPDWQPVPPVDIFGKSITNEFICGRVKPKHVKYGPDSDPRPYIWGHWIYRGIMTPESWQAHGVGTKGDPGMRYIKTDKGWLKVE
jgi:hypothetical protein